MAKKYQSGRRSPRYDLPQTVEFADVMYRKLGRGPFKRASMADALGHNLKSSAALMKIGTLRHHGLIDGRGDDNKLSALGLQILMPTGERDRAEALVAAARQPGLYADLFGRFADQRLPEMLANILVREFAVPPANVDRVVRNFTRTAEMAGLLRDGVLHDDLLSAHRGQSEDDEDAHSSSAPAEVPDVSDVGRYDPAHGSGRPWNIPLKGRRQCVLRLPGDVSESDLQIIVSWIELMKDALVGDRGDGNDN